MRRAGRRDRAARGVALIEALVALLVVAFGMVALAGLMNTMRRSADLAKQRGEALRIAQQTMENFRDYSVLTLSSPAVTNQRDFTAKIENVETATPVGADLNSNTSYTIVQKVDLFDEPPGKSVTLTLNWTDRAGDGQWLITNSFISKVDPIIAASLSIAPAYAATQRPPNGTSAVPPTAKDLGDGRSVLVPQPGATVALVFNNITGVVTSRCVISAGTQTSDLSIANLTTCSASFGYLIWGYVSFASASPLALPLSYSYAMPLDMAIVTVGAATAPSYDCFDNAPVDAAGPQTLVSYICVAYPTDTTIPDPTPADPNHTKTAKAWSGELNITGITPLAAGGWKICRYSGNYDSDAVISNAEHPLVYSNVLGALGNQNFLVIRYSETCPTGVTGTTGSAFYSTATVQHQPNGVDTSTAVH